MDAIAARGKDGKVWLSLTNLDPGRAADVNVAVPGVAAGRALGEVLTAALRTAKLDVRVTGVTGLPTSLAEMDSYDAIFLCNVSAGDLGPSWFGSG